MSDTLGQLLEFRLGSERYCIDIAYIDEIVAASDVRSLANTPDHVDGVTDLRGRTTTVVDPRAILDVDRAADCSHIIVLDGDTVGNIDGTVGWLVEDVEQVITASEEDLERTEAMDDTHLAGVLSRESGFVVQIDPRTVGA